MNKRIKKIANKAGIGYLYDYSEDGHAVVCNLTEIEKFAELVIQECIDTMHKRGKKYAHPSAGEYQAKTFSEAIIKHFKKGLK